MAALISGVAVASAAGALVMARKPRREPNSGNGPGTRGSSAGPFLTLKTSLAVSQGSNKMNKTYRCPYCGFTLEHEEFFAMPFDSDCPGCGHYSFSEFEALGNEQADSHGGDYPDW